MYIKKIINNQWFSGVVCSVITMIPLAFLKFKMDLYLWQLFGIIILCFIVYAYISYSLKRRRISRVIKSFTYSRFGNSYCYKWEYIKSQEGVYGYEPVNIQLAESKTIPEKIVFQKVCKSQFYYFCKATSKMIDYGIYT